MVLIYLSILKTNTFPIPLLITLLKQLTRRNDENVELNYIEYHGPYSNYGTGTTKTRSILR